ncbi:MAG TPA: ABC transporter permease [Blastocatellia bacterium]|nr:ABC transporter permease [Blastocatellia bacterium]
MSFQLFIALRYLRAKRQQAAVSAITAIAIAGITIGVAALLVAQAMIHGFRSDVQEKILAGTDHLNLLKEDNGGIENYRELAERIRKLPGVIEASATIYAPVLLSFSGRQEQAVLKGLDTSSTNDLSSITIEGDSRLLPSAAEESPDPNEESPVEGLIIGQQLAKALGVKLEDQITAVSAVTRLTPTGLQPRPRYTQFRVAGVFSSGWYQYDSKWAYITLPASQRLTGNGDTAGVIRLKVSDIDQVKELSQQVLAIAGKGFVTTDWQELNKPLFAALQLQHRIILIFFALLIVIAALNIITTLTMMVIEKHRDIAILRAQGAMPRAIHHIFLLQGLIIGIVGAGLGLLLGLTISLVANQYQLISVPAEIYSISHITLKLRTLDCFWVMALAIGICLLATLYPASTAARLAPAEILRHD